MCLCGNGVGQGEVEGKVGYTKEKGEGEVGDERSHGYGKEGELPHQGEIFAGMDCIVCVWRIGRCTGVEYLVYSYWIGEDSHGGMQYVICILRKWKLDATATIYYLRFLRILEYQCFYNSGYWCSPHTHFLAIIGYIFSSSQNRTPKNQFCDAYLWRHFVTFLVFNSAFGRYTSLFIVTV